jgi:hypothetical protein
MPHHVHVHLSSTFDVAPRSAQAVNSGRRRYWRDAEMTLADSFVSDMLVISSLLVAERRKQMTDGN